MFDGHFRTIVKNERSLFPQRLIEKCSGHLFAQRDNKPARRKRFEFRLNAFTPMRRGAGLSERVCEQIRGAGTRIDVVKTALPAVRTGLRQSAESFSIRLRIFFASGALGNTCRYSL
jgi:hypothetical protein